MGRVMNIKYKEIRKTYHIELSVLSEKLGFNTHAKLLIPETLLRHLGNGMLECSEYLTEYIDNKDQYMSMSTIHIMTEIVAVVYGMGMHPNLNKYCEHILDGGTLQELEDTGLTITKICYEIDKFLEPKYTNKFVDAKNCCDILNSRISDDQMIKPMTASQTREALILEHKLWIYFLECFSRVVEIKDSIINMLKNNENCVSLRLEWEE